MVDNAIYAERITSDPAIMVGKPVIAGTRIPVEIVLETLADNLDLDEFFVDYPDLTLEDVRACLDYARALAAGEDVHPSPGPNPRPAAAARRNR